MQERHHQADTGACGRLVPPSINYLVFACAKSGTTWMQRLLSAHPEIHCAETRLFGRHFDKENPSGPNITLESYVQNLSRHYHAPVGRGDDATAFYRSMLFHLTDAIADTARAASGKPIYGEKLTPYLGTAADAIDRLHEYHPGIRLVHLVRDGRDVVVSGAVQWSNLRLRTADATRASEIRGALDRHVILDEPFEFFTSLWIESVRAGQAATARFANSKTIRYEDLLESPVEQIGGVLRFIGADESMQAIERCRAAASFEALSGGRRAGQEDRSSFFRSGRAGDWRAWFSDAQREVFESRAGDLLGSFGYEILGKSRGGTLRPASSTT